MAVVLLGRVALTGADGRELAVAGAQRRGVLAALALDLGHTVPLARIYELLWDEEPPPQAKAALQGHVAALRKQLPGTGVRIETLTAAGYRLLGPAELVDYAHFRDLAARAADGAGEMALLAQALGLWRGSALAGLPATRLQRDLAAQLEEQRVQVLERWAWCQLSAGVGAAAIAALEAATRADPLRESLVALLVRALHQAGRSAEARELYERTRTRLADELGIDPSAGLRDAAALIRDGVARPGAPDPASGAGDGAAAQTRAGGRQADERAVPGLLPPPTPGFVGRAAETAALRRMCGPERVGPGRVVVTGAAGMGKTATVLHWAHSALEQFPDGQLFVDLRGFDPRGALDPRDALTAFLRALGLPETDLPDGAGELAALYQDTVRDLRLLVVLDNADDPDRIRPLIAQGPRCVTMVTSRGTLEELHLFDGAGLLVLESLAAPDAVLLLASAAGEARVRAEPEAAAQIAEFCGRLPLALLLCGARLAVRPAWRLADLVQDLADERLRLTALDVDGSRRLVAALEPTRRHLTPDGSRLLALLGLHPGTPVSVPSAAALLGVDAPTARRALGNLASYHLIEEASPGRYSRHDLIGSYCAYLAEQELGADERRDVLERLLRHYCEAVVEAGTPAATGAAVRVGGPVGGKAAKDGGQAPARTHDWFRRVEPALRELVAQAVDLGLFEYATGLARSTQTLYFAESNRLYEWEQMTALGVRAAEGDGSPKLKALMYNAHGTALMVRGKTVEAEDWYEKAVRAADASADPETRYIALNSLNNVLIKTGRGRESVAVLEDLLTVAAGLDNVRRVAQTLNNLADAWVHNGEPERALDYVDRALAIYADLPPFLHTTFAVQTRAEVLRALGRLDEALEESGRALEMCREQDSPYNEATVAEFVGDVLHELGRDREAADRLRAAVELYERQGRSAAGARAKLDALPTR